MSALVRALLAAAFRRVTSSTPWLLVDRLRYGRPGRYIWESRRIYGWMRGVEAVALLRAALDLSDDPTIVEVGSFPLVEFLAAAGAEAAIVAWSGAADPVGAIRFWRALHRAQPSIVHQHVGGPAARLLLRRGTRAPIVAHVHGLAAEAGGVAPGRVLAPGADAVIATSRAVADSLPRRDATVVYPGVALPPPSAPPDSGVVGFAGRLVPVKGLDVLS